MNPRLRILRRLHSLLVAALLLPVILLAPLLGPSGAAVAAVPTISHGQGVTWNGDHSSWLGNWLLGDGNHGYCIEVERRSPPGTSFDYADGSTAGLFGRDHSARLAYISRRWGDPGDPITAAAAQLAVWAITGYGTHDRAWYARRANADAELVMQRADRMLDLANSTGGASRGVKATVELSLSDSGSGGTVHTDLLVDYLAGHAAPPRGSHFGELTLTGATFADGSRTARVGNGGERPIVPDRIGSTESVSVEVVYRDLPFGNHFRLGRNTGGAQDLLVQSPFPVEARASDSGRAPNDLPFRPRVQTRTSEAVAVPGSTLTDALALDVHPDSLTGGEWGVYADADGALAPIPVVIESVLLGPFPRRPVESEVVPAEAPVVCQVETEVILGPGDYRSPGCVVPEAGYYVWTDSIDPARTPVEKGGGRLRGWASGFGVASETTLVPSAPSIATTASVASVDGTACVHDRLLVSGLPAGVDPIQVTSTLLGPVRVLPDAETVPAGWEQFPVAGTVTTTVAADGAHDSPCIEVSAPGFYYFVVESAAVSGDPVSPAESLAGVPPLVPAIVDRRVHTAESIHVSPVVVPPTPSATPSPTPTPSLTPPPPAPGSPTATAPGVAALAQTGGPAPSSAVSTALAVAMVIVGLAGAAVALRRRP